MLKNYFQVALRGFWKSKFFSGLSIEGEDMDNSAFLVVLIWFLPGVFGLGISYSMVTRLPDVLAGGANPELSLRNE